MLQIKYIFFNTEKIECNDKGLPKLKKPRASPRNFFTNPEDNPKDNPRNEKDAEKQYLDKIKNMKFNEENCKAIKWLKSIFPEANIKYEKIRAIVEVLALKLNKSLTREIYRRRSCCIFWLQDNLDEIASLLAKNVIFVCCGDKTYNLTSPPTSSKIPLPSVEMVANKESQTKLVQTDIDIDENIQVGIFDNFNENCQFDVFDNASFDTEYFYME